MNKKNDNLERITRDKPTFTSDINIVASIPDFNMVSEVIYLLSQGKDKEYINEEIFEKNIYGIRTLRSRKRFLAAIYTNFMKFKTEEHEKVFYSLFSQQSLLGLKKIILFIQFAINNQLFYDLTSKVTIKLYREGRLAVPKEEYISYLYDLREKSEDLQNWSNATVDIIASKYLTLLKKLGFLKGRIKKEFCNIDIDNQTLIYIVYLLKSLDYKEPDLLKNPFIVLLPITKESLFLRIKKLSLIDYFKIYTLGDDLKIDLKYSYEDIVNVIIQNYR
jgi:hypothetical protein